MHKTSTAPVAVVTGGSRGLGLEIARRLVADGFVVSLWDLDAVRLDEARAQLGPGMTHAQTVDVSSEDKVQAAAAETLAGLGPISVLVNNAGIAGPHAMTWELPLDQWRRVLDVNLTGAFLCCKAVIPQMLQQRYGRIVNISSISGKEGNAEIVAYAASKAGVISLTKTLGKELARTEIRVNCVTPAAIQTSIFDQWPEDYVESLVAKIPLGRFGRPEELAALVSWLASPAASFSTGAVFDLSGGRATY